jgi:hypothetical protein
MGSEWHTCGDRTLPGARRAATKSDPTEADATAAIATIRTRIADLSRELVIARQWAHILFTRLDDGHMNWTTHDAIHEDDEPDWLTAGDTPH